MNLDQMNLAQMKLNKMRSSIRRPFLEASNHLDQVDMTYFQHMKFAHRISIQLAKASLSLLVHGFLPFLLVEAGSHAVKKADNQLSSHT